jgi:hypothetical protein
MKIAVIIFGQPRFVNNPYCFSSQRDFIFAQGETDVFAHLWTPKDDSYVSSSWSGMTTCPASTQDLEVFFEKWNPVVMEQESPKEFRNPELFTKIKEKFPDPHWNEEDFNKAISHLYSLEKGIEVYEKGRTKEYDWVIFLRTDVCVWQFPDLSNLPQDKFYYSSIFHSEHFADICYVTDPKYVSGLKAYSYLTDPSYEIVNNLIRPCAEQFKKESFLKQFERDHLAQIPLPVRVVRNNEERGKQW